MSETEEECECVSMWRTNVEQWQCKRLERRAAWHRCRPPCGWNWWAARAHREAPTTGRWVRRRRRCRRHVVQSTVGPARSSRLGVAVVNARHTTSSYDIQTPNLPPSGCCNCWCLTSIDVVSVGHRQTHHCQDTAAALKETHGLVCTTQCRGNCTGSRTRVHVRRPSTPLDWRESVWSRQCWCHTGGSAVLQADGSAPSHLCRSRHSRRRKQRGSAVTRPSTVRQRRQHTARRQQWSWLVSGVIVKNHQRYYPPTCQRSLGEEIASRQASLHRHYTKHTQLSVIYLEHQIRHYAPSSVISRPPVSAVVCTAADWWIWRRCDCLASLAPFINIQTHSHSYTSLHNYALWRKFQ